MNTTQELAPAVESILDAATERGAETPVAERLEVNARSFSEAIAGAEADGRTPVIAEVKPTSPTTDGERDADPAELATAMVEGGAAAISVLTEPEHFGGSTEALTAVRDAIDVPVLRKDFVLREEQLDAVASDLVLLIARFLGEGADVGDRETDDLADLVAAARDRGMQPLVEVHSREELETALEAGARIVGVNNRDLAQLDVDLSTFEDVSPHAPEDVTLVAESGLSTAADARRMRAAGADALLIGSAIMDGVGDADEETTATAETTTTAEIVTENTRRFTTADAQDTTMSDANSDDTDDTISDGDTNDTISDGGTAKTVTAEDGKFGDYGGQYVPEALMPAIRELEDAYERYVLNNEDGFMDEFRRRIEEFGGRPTPLQYAENLSAEYDADVYLKREDLLHGGAHKLNNALGQVLLAKYMGKERIVAETGAGQHGTATAMAAAHLGMPCEIYMGERDITRQRPNVFRMKINGAEVVPVSTGRGTLKEAISETMRDWATTVETTHYVIGSVVGPHPFPAMVRDFQALISEEAREQIREQAGRLPDSVLACAGGGSNTMGAFHHFVDDEDVGLYAVEAGGSSLDVDEEEGVAPNSASLSTGSEGVLHGARTKLLQDGDGQIVESHSVSSGLDYAGVGPELAHLVDEERVTPVNVDDDTALEGFHRLSQREGIIPALETSHALGYLHDHHEELGEVIVVNVSGRGDKDLEAALEETEQREIDNAPDMSTFEGGL